MTSKVRVAKHRVEKALEQGRFPSENNLTTLVQAKFNIKPYIKQFKKNLDLLNKSISNDATNCK